MALQKTVNTVYGLEVEDAYIKVNNYYGDKNIINFNVEIFASATLKTMGVPPIESKVFSMPYIDGMTISILYNYLKMQPDFVYSLDV